MKVMIFNAGRIHRSGTLVALVGMNFQCRSGSIGAACRVGGGGAARVVPIKVSLAEIAAETSGEAGWRTRRSPSHGLQWHNGLIEPTRGSAQASGRGIVRP